MADESSIAAKFAEHIANASKGDSEARCSQLQEQYTNFVNTYSEETYLADYSFDVELIDKIISSLKKVNPLILTVLQQNIYNFVILSLAINSN